MFSYFVIMLPGILLALWASISVKRAFNKYSKVGISSGMSGAQVARQLLAANDIRDVEVVLHQGWLSDHYHPIKRVVHLSPAVYEGRSVAAVGIAAHEVGHAIQHAKRYSPMVVRQALVGPANIGSTLSYILIIAGFLLHAVGLIWVGILLFSAVVLFQLVTLPVEWNASTRAKQALVAHGMVSHTEAASVAKVLNAAAMTYLAALITSILTLLYYVMSITGRD